MNNGSIEAFSMTVFPQELEFLVTTELHGNEEASVLEGVEIVIEKTVS